MIRLMITLLPLMLTLASYPQQIAIPRIDEMPDLPQPYEMRDWQAVAQQYDSLVFNLDATGQYLPLTTIFSNTTNYPQHPSFGIQSYVGTYSPPGKEAINVLPAVISATLAGIDKSDQYGHNWPLYCEEYFNRRPQENVYLNGPTASSGNDWWYETMPNIFFYQLNDLYPSTGDYDHQFTTVADRWLEAVKVMGGYNAPWNIPYMNYRAFNLSDMTPLESGTRQPEAAGAIGWILYNAYVHTGLAKYRLGAEWCLEFLSSWDDNPSYELQLPCGVYTAARMNAELGTQYDIEKMLNWCFDVGDLRGWGAIVGNWGGTDVSGLIGEARDGFPGYAFNMNGFEQVGALVPMVRYDDRFARAIGKWVLNVANASRLFYSDYLPDDMEDNEEWTSQYDPGSVIAYEALREYSTGPYGTGDAVGGGWAATNLGLYGSSHVGIMGAVIEKTNIDAILQLDLLATDYYGQDAYQTYLYFNPYQEDKSVSMELPAGNWDIYNALSNMLTHNDVSGNTTLEIPAGQAFIAVLIPAGSAIDYSLNKAYVNDIVIDFNTGENVANYPPRIKSLAARDTTVLTNSAITIYCTAGDIESQVLDYNWQINSVSVEGSDTLVWQTPADTGTFLVQCIVTDDGELTDTALLEMKVVEKINYPPEIASISAQPRIMNINENSDVLCRASDANGDILTYAWSAEAGEITGSDSLVTYEAPGVQGNYYLYCRVEDVENTYDYDSLLILVKDPALAQTGELIARYTFNNSVLDFSGYEHHGNASMTNYTGDMHGNPEGAIGFLNSSSMVTVANTDDLNFQDGISVSLWLNISQLYDRESYPISHGNWQNRWKMSLGDEKLRFTINGTGGIIDLDTESSLNEDTWYHLVAIYNGTECQVLVNGELDAVKEYQGILNKTSYDLIMGQSLPGQTGYDFNGKMDNLRIYNYGISYEEVIDIYEQEISSITDNYTSQPEVMLYPNPSPGKITVNYKINGNKMVIFDLYDITGRKLTRIYEGKHAKGEYTFESDISKLDKGIYFIIFTLGNKKGSKKIIIN